MMKDFLAEVKGLFEASLQTKSLHAMSRQLQKEFRQKLKASNMCMLPSFHHTLPTGREKATILALDVGGSTFRIALIELSGKETCQASVKDDGMEIKRLKSFPIDNSVRSLEGHLFFDWMAERIDQVLDADNHEADNNADGPLPMALAWSFPIEQTSTRSGKLLAMGKGFLATAGVEGHDICDLVTAACQKRNLNLSLQAIVNDSSATLLSQAYRDSTTRISLILGTGINAAIYLPISTLDREKFGSREQSWWDEANHVLVNTELSMFGRDIWDATRWDDDLNQKHQKPDFQPLEYKTGGRFLGELVRLVIVEAVEKGVLFGGYLPIGLDVPYALDTGLISIIEGDQSSRLALAVTAFTTAHPLSTPSARPNLTEDMHFIRNVSALVTTRAAAYVATAVHALWELQRDTSMEEACPSTQANGHISTITSEERSGTKETRMTIACNGSIMEKYPDFKPRCQAYLDELALFSGQEYTPDENRRLAGVTIEMAAESSIFGAAVAAAAEEGF
ncbi:hypothetical protein BDV97DRAFT_292910 [Delphinella strobiligena]|nr:hypothetical protein BDV97DRAFT_292910 [Delphinella strobiligena]